MASHIKVTRNFTLKVDRVLSPASCREMGLMLLVRIENRTLSGRNELGSAFTPYSASYAKVKGRRSPVDLKRDGTMLKDMDVLTADGHKIELGFRTQEMWQRSRYHDSRAPRKLAANGKPIIPLRRFLSVNTAWIRDALRLVRLNLGTIHARR
jgi:hypothetical protein